MMMRLFRSKKADEGTSMSLTQIFGLILSAIAIIVMVAVIIGVVGIFTKEPDKGTVNQYNSMLEGVEILMHPSNNETGCKLPVGYIESNFAIVGFNRKDVPNSAGEIGEPGDEEYGYIEDHCGVDDNIYKPEMCFESACLCLCDGGTVDVTGEDCFSGRCQRLDDKTSRLFTYQDSEVVDLVLYGESCWAGWDNGVLAGYIVEKSQGSISVKAYTDTSEFSAKPYPLCSDIAKNFRKVAPAEKKEENKGPAVTESLDKAGISASK